MGFPDFFNKDKKKKKNDKKFEPEKIIGKCKSVLKEIEEIEKERYQKLMKTFNSQYDKANIQKKKIQGFYAQLVDELKSLQGNAQERIYKTGEQVTKKAKKIAKKVPAAKASKKVVKKVAKRVEKKVAKKVEKKTTKKTAKVEKKVTKKVAKKTTKKKPAAAAKTTKKVAKKTKKKTAKKKA